MTVNRTLRGRGATILETDKGYRRLMEFKGTYGRLEFTHQVTKYLKKNGIENIDTLVTTREGELFSCDEYGDKYIVTEWFPGSECDVKSEADILRSMSELAKIHNVLKCGFIFCMPVVKDDDGEKKQNICIPVSESIEDEYRRHNIEMKRTAAYIRDRKKKNNFEYSIIKNIEEYIEYGMIALENMEKCGCREIEKKARERNEIIHGNYNYHNILFDKSHTNGKKIAAIVNFERAMEGPQIKDVYLFLRKVMEKHNWDITLGHKMLETYNEEKTISSEEYKCLKIMLEYPEKYWKVINHYLNSNKAWVPEKSEEKLLKIYFQEKNKKEFIYSM